MLPKHIKAKLIAASITFKNVGRLFQRSERYLCVLDVIERNIVCQSDWKRFPLGYGQEIILYDFSIKDDVMKVAKVLSKTSMAFVGSVAITKSFMTTIDHCKHDNNRYVIISKLVEELNRNIIGNIEMIISFPYSSR